MAEQTEKQPVISQDESAAETEGHRVAADPSDMYMEPATAVHAAVHAEPSDMHMEPDTEVEGHRVAADPADYRVGPSHKPEGQE